MDLLNAMKINIFLSLFLFFHFSCARIVAVAVAAAVARMNRLVPPEYPLVLNRWGHQLNGTVLGPMEEGDDIVLTCRVTGGKPRNSIVSLHFSFLFFHRHTHTQLPLQLIQFSAQFFLFLLHLSPFFCSQSSIWLFCFFFQFFSMYFHSSCSGHFFLFRFSPVCMLAMSDAFHPVHR